MKTGFFVVHCILAILFDLVVGLPQYVQNDLAVRAYVTTTAVVVKTMPAVIVHVHGTRTWTETRAAITLASATPTTRVPTYPSVSHLQSTTAAVSRWKPPPGAQSDAKMSTSRTHGETLESQAASIAPAVLGSSASRSGYGISYNPYNADGTCKDAASVASDIDSLDDYGVIRLYGTDCGQLDTVMPAVKRHAGMKVFLGIYHCESTDAARQEADAIVAAVNEHFGGDWSLVHTVSVGNEVIDRGEASVASLLATLQSIQRMLRPYGVPVVTVETPGVFQDGGGGQALCQASDYTAINVHPFFDKSGAWTEPQRAGDFARLMARVVAACGHARTVIAESGWPHGSDLGEDYFRRHGLPVPSPANHAAAIESLKQAFAGREQDLVVFSALNDLWKHDTPLTMGVEHYWGILS